VDEHVPHMSASWNWAAEEKTCRLGILDFPAEHALLDVAPRSQNFQKGKAIASVSATDQCP
jgi:hypothetical protein